MFDVIQDFLSGSVYYDLPSFEVAVFSLLLGFVLSTCLAFTYRLTFRGKIFPNHFFQAMILSSLVTGMIMMAVGNNFAVGFGIIGAVAIIRFRTLITDPRNIIFMFAAISIGIATGVKGYAIAVAGTALFCLVSFLLYWSPFGTIHFRYRLVLVTSENTTGPAKMIVANGKSVSHRSTRKLEGGLERNDFLIELDSEEDKRILFRELSAHEGVVEVRFDALSTSEDQL